MKIDTDDNLDIGVFKVKVSHKAANAWLVNSDHELEAVNSAIDEAVSFAEDNERSFVLIEIAKP